LHRWVISTTLCTALLVGCNDQSCVCTLEFESIQLSVVNPAGQPEPGVLVQTRLVRTGTIIHPLASHLPPGVYTILDDTSVGLLQFQGDTLHVAGSKSGLSFTAEFVARPDGPCRCHIEKVSGPRVATLQ
jgi:hypothetical protein